MKDIQKIKEFFSKPLEEAKTVELNDKQKKYLKSILNNRYGKGAELAYIDNGIEEFIQRTKLDLSKEDFQDLLNQDILKIRTKPDKKKPYKALFLSKDLTKMNLDEAVTSAYEATDINDPVLMKARAAAFQRTQPKPEPTKPSMSFKNIDKIKALKLKKAQLMRDMEQEAELEGGPIADRYGRELEKIDRALAMLREAEEETAVDMAKKQLDALGVKYELGNEFKPFKAIYRPINKSDRWYDKFEDIIHLFNLGSAVKQSMNESNGFTSGKEFINIKLKNYPKAVAKINQLIDMIGESNFTMEMAKWIWDFFNNASFENPVNEAKSISDYKVGDIISFKDGEDWKVMKVKDNVGKLVIKPHNEKAKKGNVSLEIDIDADYLKKNLKEAKKEDAVDTITMDIPLFLRMLEYSREDASQDMDLHDVTEKANKLGKERGILSMEDYEEIVGAAEEIKEVNLKQSKLSSAEYQKAKKLKDFKASDWKWNADEDLYTKVNEGELTEAKSFTIDSYSASDSDKITDFLTQNNINFKKVGPKIKISLDRDTPKASVILSKLNKLAKFDELNEGELLEAYVPSNIKEFAKRKGVSSLVNKVAGWAEKVGKSITGGTAIGYNYSTLILDMTYQGSEIRINTNNDTVTLYDEPVRSFSEFQRVYADGQDDNLEEKISKTTKHLGHKEKELAERILVKLTSRS